MMRRTIMLSVVCLVAVAMLMADTAAGVSEIHVVQPYDGVPSQGTFVDEDRDGNMDQGDQLVGWSSLLDAAGVERVGTLYTDCVVQKRIRADAGLAVCDRVLNLKGGTVTLRGLDPGGTGVTTWAVTGGSGVYAGATGDATLTETSQELDIVVHLAA